MNDQERRQIFAHGAMGLAACIGAYMALVDGPRKQLTATRGQNVALAEEVRAAESLRDMIPAMTAAMDRVAREETQIKETGRLAREERALFAAVMSLASAHHVRIDELNPVRSPGPAKAPPPPPGQAATPPANDTTVGYSMVAIASYDDVTAFITAMRSELGYSLIRTLRMTPVQDERVKLVRALLETEHYSFDTSPPKSPVADAGAH